MSCSCTQYVLPSTPFVNSISNETSCSIKNSGNRKFFNIGTRSLNATENLLASVASGCIANLLGVSVNSNAVVPAVPPSITFCMPSCTLETCRRYSLDCAKCLIVLYCPTCSNTDIRRPPICSVADCMSDDTPVAMGKNAFVSAGATFVRDNAALKPYRFAAVVPLAISAFKIVCTCAIAIETELCFAGSVPAPISLAVTARAVTPLVVKINPV